MRPNARILAPILLLALALILPQPLEAQYFGRNKVQWQTFDFKVLKTEHFDIYYYDDAAPIIEDVARMSERWYDRLSTVFGHEFERKPIVIYANHPDFQQTNTTQGFIDEGTGGFTDSFLNRVVLPLTGTYAENDHVLGHELVHVFQFDIASRLSTSGRRFRLQAMPLWMIEGLAEYLSQGRLDPQTAMWVRDAVVRDDLPDLREFLRNPRLSPYQLGQAFWAYIGGRWSDRAVVETFFASGFLGPEGGIQRVLGISGNELITAWHDAARQLYAPTLTDRWGPDRLGDPLVEQVAIGQIDVSPSLSPDGRHVAFLSSRDLFSIDLFLADAQTGEVIDRLVTSRTNPHIDALRFLDSSGTWSPDGKKLAFVVTERGDNRIAILDVDSRKIEQRFEIPELPAVMQLAWSPDGSRLAVSGMRNGVSDLYLWNLASKSLTQVTDDKYADLQPAWSPDGRTVAVVSDRGSGTSFETLEYAKPRISLIDIATGRIQTLEIFEGAKHINPQFSTDGSSLFFISDPDGISDVFRYWLDDGALDRITKVATGVAGITDFSPAMTIASRTGDAIYTHFRDGRWTMYRAGPNALEGERITPVMVADASMRAGTLPPAVSPTEARAAATQVANYLDDPALGLPPPSTSFTSNDYSSKLRLSYIGPPTFGASFGGDYGNNYGGSFYALFTDILGNHQVGVTLQGGQSSGGDFGTLFGGEAYYLNLKNRVQWGVAASHIPYVGAAARQRRTETIEGPGGTPVLADVLDTLLEKQVFDEVTLLSRYPFGTTRRVELNAGFSNRSFDRQIVSDYFVNGSYLGTATQDTQSFGSLSWSTVETAFVGDSSFFGFVSPISGTRYRYSAEAITGDLNFQSGLADHRKYFLAQPWTFAVRGLFYGRYGDDAEDNRISPLFIGNQNLVRGYDSGSFEGSECTRIPGGSGCPEFDRLIGSKMALASMELRVPLFGVQGYGLIEAPYFPTELLGFVDVGAAWTENQDVTWKFERDTTERVPVASAGVAARILLGGYLPIQLYYAFPFQRPQEDSGIFGFMIAPGW